MLGRRETPAGWWRGRLIWNGQVRQPETSRRNNAGRSGMRLDLGGGERVWRWGNRADGADGGGADCNPPSCLEARVKGVWLEVKVSWNLSPPLVLCVCRRNGSKSSLLRDCEPPKHNDPRDGPHPGSLPCFQGCE